MLPEGRLFKSETNTINQNGENERLMLAHPSLYPNFDHTLKSIFQLLTVFFFFFVFFLSKNQWYVGLYN